MQGDEYKTKDIGEAAALHSSGIKLLRLDKDNNFFWFIFENTQTEEVSASYWSGDLIVKAKLYNDSFRNLKERIFSRG